MFVLTKNKVYYGIPTHSAPAVCMVVGFPTLAKAEFVKQIHFYYEHELLTNDENDFSIYDDNTVVLSNPKEVKMALRKGKHVIYDGDHMKKSARIGFLQELSNITCFPMCIVVAEDYLDALVNSPLSESLIYSTELRKVLLGYCPPMYTEGFNRIEIVGKNESSIIPNKYSLSSLFERFDSFDQHNSHHKFSLGEHCKAAYDFVKSNYPVKIDILDNDGKVREDKINVDKVAGCIVNGGLGELNRYDRIALAALLHDIGKPFTVSRTNAKGKDDGEYHYYNHHHVGAYDAMFYLSSLGVNKNDGLYICNLIYYHMKPFTSWAQSEKSKTRDMKRIGKTMYEDIMILHKADLEAH